MRTRRLENLIVWLLALLFSVGWNEVNVQALADDPAFANRLSAAGTLVSPDNPSYLKPVEQWIAGIPQEGPAFRTPGYGLWYALVRVFAPAPAALKGLALLQCALFALAVAFFFHTLTVCGFGRVQRWSWALLLAVVPMFHGFLYHALTEGVTPSLTLAIWCCALCHRRGSDGRWLAVGVVLWALLVLTRPVLLWVGFPLLVAAWQVPLRGAQRALPALLLVLACLPTAVFWLRNAALNNGPISLHPVYSADEQGLFRPTHQAFWELAKSWGTRGDAFHSVMVPAYEGAVAGAVDTVWATALLRTAPAGHLDAGQQAAVREHFVQWQLFTRDRLAPAIAGVAPPLHGQQAEEEAIVAGLGTVTDGYRRAHAWHYHVVVPGQVLWELVGHSNLSLFIFQHPWRGAWAMEVFRWACALLHVALFAGLLAHFVWRTDVRCRVAAAGTLLYLAYLAYVQRGVEERYTLPVLFLAVGMAPWLVEALRKWWAGKCALARSQGQEGIRPGR